MGSHQSKKATSRPPQAPYTLNFATQNGRKNKRDRHQSKKNYERQFSSTSEEHVAMESQPQLYLQDDVADDNLLTALDRKQIMLLSRRARQTASLFRLEQEGLSPPLPPPVSAIEQRKYQQLTHDLTYHLNHPKSSNNPLNGPTWRYGNNVTNACNDNIHNMATLAGAPVDDDSCCCSGGGLGTCEEVAGGAITTASTVGGGGCRSHDCDFGYGSGYGLESCDCAIVGAPVSASRNRVGNCISGGGLCNGVRHYNGKRLKLPSSEKRRQHNNIAGSNERLDVHRYSQSPSLAGSRRARDLSHSPPPSSSPTTYRAPTTRSEQLFSSSTSTSGNIQHQATYTKQLHRQIIRNMSTAAHLQRGLAYDEDERVRLNLLGVIPPARQTQELQARAVMNFIENCCQDELSRYVYLRSLKDFNEHLFYYTMMRNVEKLMPLVYTPTVGLACQKFSHIYLRPRGLYVTINDLGRVDQLLSNWPEKDVRVIVVTDGERILGLGDLGANGMGISIGKLSLYTALAGIPPKNVLPVCLDVGTNNEYNLKDEFYIGLRHNRVRGAKYDQLVEEFLQSVAARWGRSCLIQFEDFANATAFDLLQRYRLSYCTFNDDIQGTASVCLSGLISAAKLIGRKLSTCSFLFYGAGEANLGTAKLLMMAMMEDGATRDEAKSLIWLVDSKGLVVDSRKDLTGHKREFARTAETPQVKDLESVIRLSKPTAIIGASAQAGAFNETICRLMVEFNQQPIIFALSNPTSKAECSAEQAYQWTDGKCVFASGSPFDPVVYNGKTFITGQGNNAYIFPGVGLASIAAHTHTIPEETFLIAARALSDQLEPSDTEVGLVYPRLNRIREVTLRVATRVLEYLYTERLATFRPEPNDKMEFLRSIQYDTRYESEPI